MRGVREDARTRRPLACEVVVAHREQPCILLLPLTPPRAHPTCVCARRHPVRAATQTQNYRKSSHDAATSSMPLARRKALHEIDPSRPPDPRLAEKQSFTAAHSQLLQSCILRAAQRGPSPRVHVSNLPQPMPQPKVARPHRVAHPQHARYSSAAAVAPRPTDASKCLKWHQCHAQLTPWCAAAAAHSNARSSVSKRPLSAASRDSAPRANEFKNAPNRTMSSATLSSTSRRSQSREIADVKPSLAIFRKSILSPVYIVPRTGLAQTCKRTEKLQKPP
jgi:hypothetical protein